MKPRSHFSRSYSGRFPQYLLDHQLLVDDRDYSVSYCKESIIGESSHHVDLRYWECADVANTLRSMLQFDSILLGPRDNLSSVLLTLKTEFASNVKFLAFEPSTPLHDEDFLTISGLTSLQSLRMPDMGNLTDSLLETMLRSIGGTLEHLFIGKCSKLTDMALQAAVVYCPKLSSLDVSDNDNFTNAAISTVSFRRQSLMDLNISNCKKVSFLGLLIKQGDLLQYANRNWTSLNISGCKLEKESLVWISSALTDLVSVNLSSVLGITNDIMEGLALNCAMLKNVNLSHCTRVTDESIRALSDCCTLLEDVNISCIGNIASTCVTQLIKRNSNLETLDVSGNLLVADGLFADTTKITRIKKLNLRSTGLTSFGIACMAERCPLLKHLNISKQTKVKDAAIIVVSECCPYLESFIANDCYGLSDDGMIKLALRCRFLTTLSVSASKMKMDAWGGRFEQYTDEFMEAVLGCCKRLQTLILVNQHGIKLKSNWLVGR